MTSALFAEPKDRLIVALDVDDPATAMALALPLVDFVGMFKVAATFMHAIIAIAANYDVVTVTVVEDFFELASGGIFYDCKLHDIPEQVERASAVIAGMKVKMFNVHCLGGVEMMRAARRGADRGAKQAGKNPPLILGVTILTTHDYPSLVKLGLLSHVVTAQLEHLMAREMERLVVTLAKLAKECGLDGVVASAKEARVIREACGKDFLIVTPGIRPAGSPNNDQKRVLTPREAIEAGADLLVVGRPITENPDPPAIARLTVSEMATAWKEVT